MALRETDLPEHDPALAEAAREGGDDEVAVIARISDLAALPPGVRVVTRFGDVVTLRARVSQMAALAASEGVLAVEASRSLGPADDDREEEVDAGTVDEGYTRRPPGVRSTGSGVVLAAIDWGCDIAHPAFLDEAGHTRLLALWDQRGAEGTGPGNRWGYGRIFHADEIDRALRAPDPYAALGYHHADFDRPSPDGGRTSGTHGSHVLDIAAGSGLGDGMPGVAPGAALVFVNLAGTTEVLGRSDLGSSAAVLEALDFIFSVAGDRPCVVNMSLGAHGGPHDGTTLVERGIDRAVWLQSGRAVVCSAGNYYDADAHAQGRIHAGEVTELSFSVPPGDPTRSELELWYAGADRLSVAVVGPDGTELARVRPGDDAPLIVDGAVVGRAYHARKVTNKDHQVDVFLRPGAPGGVWRLALRGEAVEDGRYHAWIERERGPRPRFVPGDVARTSTVGTICCGRLSITVGAHDPRRERRLGEFSSAGPTRDGRVKPELAAPGDRIRAARSAARDEAPGAHTTVKSGTSMAAPHVAGCVALMMEAAGRPLDISDTRALLFASADRTAFAGGVPAAADLHRVGHGYLDIVAAEAAAREWARAEAARALPAIEATGEGDPTRADPADAELSQLEEEHMLDQDEATPGLAGEELLDAPEDDAGPAGEVAFEASARAEPTTETSDLGEAVSLDDVASEMEGLRCRFLGLYRARRADGTERTFAEDAVLRIERWNGTGADAVVDGFPVPKLVLAPHVDRVATVRRYVVGLDAQRRAVVENARRLREWSAQEASYRANHDVWEREKARLEGLLAKRSVVYGRMWVQWTMYNRFDVPIAAWTQHYNQALRPAADLDPNVPKSILYQESRMGTSGQHLMPPPSDWGSSARHPIRSRFNIGQAIDSWGPQQWLMMREMAPAIFARHGLGALEAGRRWFGMSNAEYGASEPFMRALREFFEHRDGGRNLMGTPGRDLHEDYGFWIRAAIRWLFVKYSSLRTPSWAEAVRAYNGGGAAARRYRDAVMARVGSLEPFREDLHDADSGAEALFAPVAEEARLDRSAVLEWEDLTRIPDSRGQRQVFYLVTGAPAGIAAAGDEGKAVFHLRVRNTNDHYNHQDVVTLWRLLDIQKDRQFRTVVPWQAERGPELEDESSRVMKLALQRKTLVEAYDPDSPLTRLEVEYRWREAGERMPSKLQRPHVNRTGLDFVLVAPIEYLFGRMTRLSAKDLELKERRHKDDFWIPLTGVNFTEDVRTPVKVQLDVERTFTRGGEEQRTVTAGQTRTTTKTQTVSKTFSLQLSGEASSGASAKGSIEVLELGLERMFKLGGSVGYSRERTDTTETSVAREFSRSLSLSRTYSAGLSSAVHTEIEVQPPTLPPPPRGTGKKAEPEPPPQRFTESVGVYLYPLIAFFEVPYVKFGKPNRLGQATTRTTGKVAVPYITSWRMTTHRGG